MKPFFYLACVGVLFVATWMRFEALSSPPLHADEAVQARIAAAHFETQDGKGQASADFNPQHFHGPLLGDLAALSARLAGQASWQTLTASTLRLVPALSGLAVVVLLLAAAPLIGRKAALWAGAFAAVSPFLIHFNRLFIHESLLALCLMAALFLLGLYFQNRAPAWPVGICLGLAAATKESFLLTPAAGRLPPFCCITPGHPRSAASSRTLWPSRARSSPCSSCFIPASENIPSAFGISFPPTGATKPAKATKKPRSIMHSSSCGPLTTAVSGGGRAAFFCWRFFPCSKNQMPHRSRQPHAFVSSPACSRRGCILFCLIKCRG